MKYYYAGKSKNYSGSMYFFIPAKCYCRVASALACRSIAKVNRSICELGRGGGCHTSWVHRHAIASHIHATDERLTHTHTHTHINLSEPPDPRTKCSPTSIAVVFGREVPPTYIIIDPLYML